MVDYFGHSIARNIVYGMPQAFMLSTEFQAIAYFCENERSNPGKKIHSSAVGYMNCVEDCTACIPSFLILFSSFLCIFSIINIATLLLC